MTASGVTKQYSSLEETINVASHGLGFLLSLMALAALWLRTSDAQNVLTMVSFCIFGSSLVITYGTSTWYHSTRAPTRRSRLRIMDHASIFILIAGTYTPFTLITLQGTLGWTIFGVSWGMAVTGIVVKLFFTGRFQTLSTLMYVFMGWLILFAIGPLIENFPAPGMVWLVSGGLAYTTGAVLYHFKKIPLNHAVFHVFTLVGSACHFLAVYLYV